MARIRFHYGWLVMAAAFLSTGLAVGTGQYSFGVFVQPLESEFGWSRTQVNAGISFPAIAMLSGPVLGRIIDKVGARPVMILSLIVLGISFAFRPFMTQLWHWYVLGILQAVATIGATMLPAARLVGIWFQKTRGRIMGLVTMGNNMPLVISTSVKH